MHFCPNTPTILVGCKSDLRDNKRCIEQLQLQGLVPIAREEGETLAKSIGASYIECSSKEMINVDETFELAMDLAVAQHLGLTRGQVPSQNSNKSQATSQSFQSGQSGGPTPNQSKKRKARTCKIL